MGYLQEETRDEKEIDEGKRERDPMFDSRSE
jgi:hypothetical protein